MSETSCRACTRGYIIRGYIILKQALTDVPGLHKNVQMRFRPISDCEGAGAAGGTRTPDPLITNEVLYQLSYCGFPNYLRKLAISRHFARMI